MFWKGKFWCFGKGNFDVLKREILTFWKGKFWRFEKGNFDVLEREILTFWKEKFWQFGKGNFEVLKREILTFWKRKTLTTKNNEFRASQISPWVEKKNIYKTPETWRSKKKLLIKTPIKNYETKHSCNFVIRPHFGSNDAILNNFIGISMFKIFPLFIEELET